VDEKTFNVGDEVTWDSQSMGSWKSKKGKVVYVIPAGVAPTIPEVLQSTHKRPSLPAKPLPRKHESYLVAVQGGPKAKPQLYWPIVSKLEPTKKANTSRTPDETVRPA